MKYQLNQVYNEDCVQAMKQMPDNYFDLAIVDPEYGIGASKPSKKPNKAKQKSGAILNVKSNNYTHKDWDNKPAGSEYFKELMRVSEHQIIWGVNYYSEIMTGGRIVWDKLNGDTDQFGCEIAYCSLNNRTDIIRFLWSGMIQGASISKNVRKAMMQQSNKKLNEKRIHPTQKPVQLYKWLLDNYAAPDMKILDTHLGSASSILAMIDYGCDWMAFETDEEYYDNALKRINGHIRKPKIDFEQTGKVYTQLKIE